MDSGNYRSDKRAPSIVVEGLATTSDKIRALAREGYLRAEIAEFLDIRYQHARKVMIDAGITDGQSRGGSKGTSRAVERLVEKSDPHKPTPVSVLTDAGFMKLGNWIADEHGKIALNVPAPKNPGVYAFATDGLVRYIGLTRVGFDRRMQNYRIGNVRQRTSHRINANHTAAHRRRHRGRYLPCHATR